MRDYFIIASTEILEDDNVDSLFGRANERCEELEHALNDLEGVIDFGQVGSGTGFGYRDKEYQITVDKEKTREKVDEILDELFETHSVSPEVTWLESYELTISEGHTNDYYKINWDGGELEYYYTKRGGEYNHLNTLDVGDGLEDVKGEYFDEFQCVNDYDIEEAIESYIKNK